MTNANPAAASDKPAKPAKKQGFLAELGEITKTVVYALLIALALRVLLFQPYTIPSASEEPNLYRGDYIIVSKWSYGWSHNSIPFSPPLFKGRIFFTPPKRGDIIVFKLPNNGPNPWVHPDFIKRLVGLPGDKIQMKDGQLYVNGAPLKEVPAALPKPPSGIDTDEMKGQLETNSEGRTYLTQVSPTREAGEASGSPSPTNTVVYVVPPHCYFMMGDNRDDSLDSRFDPQLVDGDPKLGGCGLNNGLTSDNPGVGFVPEENLVGKAQIVLMSWNTGPDPEDESFSSGKASKGASIFLPWTWFTDARPSRFFHLLK